MTYAEIMDNPTYAEIVSEELDYLDWNLENYFGLSPEVATKGAKYLMDNHATELATTILKQSFGYLPCGCYDKQVIDLLKKGGIL